MSKSTATLHLEDEDVQRLLELMLEKLDDASSCYEDALEDGEDEEVLEGIEKSIKLWDDLIDRIKSQLKPQVDNSDRSSINVNFSE